MTDRSGDPRRERRERTDSAAEPRRDEAPVLPPTTRDDSPEGWGERDDAESDDERYHRERPPHHEG